MSQQTMSNASTAAVKARISISHRMWEMSTFLLITGGMLAAGGWYLLAYSDSEFLALLPKQINTLIVTCVLHTNLVAIAAFGLGSLYSKDGTMLDLYAVLLWNHFALSLITGSFLIWSVLHGDPTAGGVLNGCTTNSTVLAIQRLCEYNFDQVRGIMLGTTAALWIIELAACIMASRFVGATIKEEDRMNVYEGPETDVFWVPQMSPAESDIVIDMPEEGEVDEYKTPRTAEFSRYGWV